MVEIAWIQKSPEGPKVHRFTFNGVGSTFNVQTSNGLIIFVLSQDGVIQLPDSEVAQAVLTAVNTPVPAAAGYKQ